MSMSLPGVEEKKNALQVQKITQENIICVIELVLFSEP